MLIPMIINRAIIQGIPLLYGSTGEIITEKSGNLNLGIPGIMYVGAISGVAGAFFYETGLSDPAQYNKALGVLIPLLCCLAGSALMGLIFCFLTVTLRANQNVTGLALTTFGIGVGNFFGASLTTITGSDVASISLSQTGNAFKTFFTIELKIFGESTLTLSILAIIAVIVALISAFVLRKTRLGLHLRAVGESPATADADGIPVSAYKYGATVIGSAIAGLGGLYYVMDYMQGVWANDGFGDRGWLAIALVIFAVWRPDMSILGSALFGALYIAQFYAFSGVSVSNMRFVKMLPYVVTIIVLIFTSIMDKKENHPPKSLGLPYFREDR